MSEQTSSKGRSITAIALVLGIFATAAGVWFGADVLQDSRGPDPATMKAGTLLPTPKPLAPFELVDQDAKPFQQEQLKGRWTFVFFGYTSCPDVCPTTMATLQALDRLLSEDGTDTAEFLFVSVDPERDDPERLTQYVRYFSPQFLGATGTHEQLRALTRQLGVLYARVDDQDTAMSYLVDHSASILLLDPDVRLAAIFSAPHDIAAMAEDFGAISGR